MACYRNWFQTAICVYCHAFWSRESVCRHAGHHHSAARTDRRSLTRRWRRGPLMSAFPNIPVFFFFSNSRAAMDVFFFLRGNFWVIVMSCRRQRRHSRSRHGAQLSASTCRSRSRLFGVALVCRPTPQLPSLCPLLSDNEAVEGGCDGTSTVNKNRDFLFFFFKRKRWMEWIRWQVDHWMDFYFILR